MGHEQRRSSRVHARPGRADAGQKRGFDNAHVASALLGVSEACGGVVKRVARLMPDGSVAVHGVAGPSSRYGARQIVDARAVAADEERGHVHDAVVDAHAPADDAGAAPEGPEGAVACPVVHDDFAPSAPVIAAPQPVRIRGRGHERRLQIAALNHGLKSTTQFWEGERLKVRLYNKIPMPRCAARGETRVGNWTAPVYPLDEERSAVYERDEDTTIQMFEALERIADGPEERGDKLHAFTQRKRPLHGQLKTYRCRAYPTAKQAKILKKFCQVQTFDAYNAAIDVIKEKPSCSLTWVRNRVKAALNWDKRDVPADVVQAGVIEARNAYLSNERKRLKALHERNERFRYELKHRSPKTTPVVRCTFRAMLSGVKHVDRDDASSRTVRLDFARGAQCASAFRELGVVKVREGALGDLEDKFNFRVTNARTHMKISAQKENISFEYDSRRRRWYLVVLYDAPAPPQKKTPAECVDMAVFDLGVRTPATIFSPITGDVFEPYPRELREHMKRRWHRMQQLQSQIAQRNWSRERHKRGPKYRRTRKQYARTTRRMKATLQTRHLEFAQWMRWVHRSVAKTVAARYDAIACAPLDLKHIFARQLNDTAGQRVIKRRSRRVTHALSLRRCTEALKYACAQAGKIVVIERAIESGTSKTCGNCGWENDALGHAREFVCHMCDITIGRDWNGARNNALQVLADGGFGMRRDATSVDLLERHGAMARANAARRRDISRPISWTNLGTTRDDARGFLELERGTDTRRVIHRRARATDD
uniref:Cas12f1-like TNB domain-containing protein n=1 Tax=Ostreococcus mediterraneus TaxID=1486918 RepID=A0A7S0KFF4_9CHLO